MAAQLHDPFATTFLHRGRSPLTLIELLKGLDEGSAEPGGLPNQQVFLAGDGGQIPWTPETSNLARELRFAIVRHRGADAELMVSTAAPFDSTEIFLQVLAWDPTNSAFQFYERRRGAWFWAGSSWEALDEDMRGRGPFDSHVNGGMVMKELKVPWLHWHSMSGSITTTALAPDDPLSRDAIFTSVESADKLETLCRGGLSRWTEARFSKRTENGKLKRAREFFRQIVETTSVNLTTTQEISGNLTAGDTLRLPRTFFLNSDALLSALQLRPAFPVPVVLAEFYLECLQKYEVRLRDQSFVIPGDTHFAFPVPEAALEDLVVLKALLKKGFLPPKLGACLLMVDFPNPVFSLRRKKLSQYLPDSVGLVNDSDSFASLFIEAVEKSVAAGVNDSPENELLELWAVPDDAWQTEFASRLTGYIEKVFALLGSPEGFDRIYRLAVSRQREFLDRKLAEFSLTMPRTNIPDDAPLLEMMPDGTVRDKRIPN